MKIKAVIDLLSFNCKQTAAYMLTLVRILRGYLLSFNSEKSPIIRPPRNDNEIFVIFGCGDSVSSLDDSGVELISKNFSVGINMSVLADISLDYYAIEDFPNEECFLKFKSELVKKKTKQKLLVHPLLQKKPQYLNNLKEISEVYLFKDVHIASGKSKEIFSSVLRKIKYFISNRSVKRGIVFTKRGTVSRLVLLAISSGFKKIIFVGIDLNGSDYFWKRKSDIYTSEPWIDKCGIYSRHNSGGVILENGVSMLTLYEVLECIRDVYCDKGIEFYTLSSKTKLDKLFPQYIFH